MQELPLHLIQAFLTFARSENTSIAANSLQISQPSLSRHLAEFESLLGQKVFLPQGRNKELSPLGQEIFQKLSTHWQDYSQLIATTVSGFQQHPINPIHLYGPSEWLNRICLLSSLQFPLRCIPSLSENVESEMKKHRGISIGLTRKLSKQSDLTASLLFDAHFEIIFSKKLGIMSRRFNPSLLKELSSIPRLSFREDSKDSAFASLMEKSGIQNHLIMPNWSVLIELVKQGRGWTAAPTDVLQSLSHLSSLQTIEIPKDVVHNNPYYLLYFREHKKIPWFQKFLAEIEKSK